MLPVLSPSAIREADAWTMAHEPITSLALMERAAGNCAARLVEMLRNRRFGPVRTIAVVCGMGNNGGDGLAMARMLANAGYSVHVVRVWHRQSASKENERNHAMLAEHGIPVLEVDSSDRLRPMDVDLIVDALVGTGLSAPLSGLAREAVHWMNAMDCPKLAIDMPSGLFAESNDGNASGAIVRAAFTLTLHVPKLSLLLPENSDFVGEWELVPIGLDEGFLRRLPTSYRIIERADARALLKPRPRFGHKGTFGHALLLGGGLGRFGSMVMAGNAALRSGAGLVSVVVPDEGLRILQVSSPEAMCIPGHGSAVLGSLPPLEGYSAVSIGPGLTSSEDATRVLKELIDRVDVPLVIDADALGILALRRELLGALPQRSVLTPHPREFDRLAGRSFASGFDRLQHARQLATDWTCHIVLKGAFTATCAPDGSVHFNTTGNAGMAKGGSGDALTGLLAGILAQGYALGDACHLGVHLHGLAGDIASSALGQHGMTAMDLVHALPKAWQRLMEPD